MTDKNIATAAYMSRLMVKIGYDKHQLIITG